MRVGGRLFFVFGGGGVTTTNLGVAIRLRTESVTIEIIGGGDVEAMTGTTTLLAAVTTFFGGCAGRGGVFCVVSSRVVDDCICIVDGMAIVGCIFPPVRGKTFGGAVVVSTLGLVAGILLAVSTLGGSAAMIVFIGTLGINAGSVDGVFPPGRAGIAKGSGCGGRGVTKRKLGGGAVCVALSAKIVAMWLRVRRAPLSTGARGLAGDGCASVLVRLLEAAMAQSTKDATGITRRVGSHARVSSIRSALVCHT